MMHKSPQGSDDAQDPQDALDQRLDEALKERFRPPTTDSILEAAGVAPVSVPGPAPASPGSGPLNSMPSGPLLWTALAAAAALRLGVLLFDRDDSMEPVPQDERVTEWITTYDELRDGGPAPVCSCEPECNTFTEHCLNTFAQAIDIPADVAVELLGESCCDPAGGSVSLAARCEGETVCLFVLLREAAPIIHEKLRRGLSIHRRDFGILSAFELSSLPEPTILPHLVVN